MNLESDDYVDEENRYASNGPSFDIERNKREEKLRKQRARDIAVTSDFNRYLIDLFNRNSK